MAVALAAWLLSGASPSLAGGGEEGGVAADASRAEAVIEETQKSAINDLADELRRIVDSYGPDSVALQAKFLMRCTAAGAVGATEVKVAGPSTRLGGGYLEIDVDTGLLFAEAAGTPQDRADMVWRDLAAPALEEMTSFHLNPAGLEVVFVYRVQDMSASNTGHLDPSIGGRSERLSVALDQELLAAVARDELAGDELRWAADFHHSPPLP